ncbi:dCTP deaminase [Stutzerimonas degradans]|uniref:dCTP deaminase n=1 Tax=Stutzerimonas degradans TaxID=2968968 RepID=UPI0014222264|nr:hypothetical protein [Stutzerimonas degradans]NHW02554.1 hypothetical protein [Stutzerimonas degradans]
MGFLSDTDLRQKASDPTQLLIENIPGNKVNEAIRGCSVDLHAGVIYKPGNKDGALGSASNPLKMGICLKEGETAVIQTVESFKLDSKHAAFVLPKSSVSIQGLLMTNPGHVEPGYVGPVHVTVINMGREPFSIKPGSKFLRAFIYELAEEVDSPYAATTPTLITQELLEKLSPDFLSVAERASEAATRQIAKTGTKLQLLQLWVPVLVAAIVGSLGIYFSNTMVTSKFDSRISDLEKANAIERLQKLESNYPTEKRLHNIESKLDKLTQSQTAPAPIPSKN